MKQMALTGQENETKGQEAKRRETQCNETIRIERKRIDAKRFKQARKHTNQQASKRTNNHTYKKCTHTHYTATYMHTYCYMHAYHAKMANAIMAAHVHPAQRQRTNARGDPKAGLMCSLMLLVHFCQQSPTDSTAATLSWIKAGGFRRELIVHKNKKLRWSNHYRSQE